MSDQEINIAIANICGWTWIENPVTHTGGYWERGLRGGVKYERGDWGSKELGLGLPNYATDLNAMHEAVLAMPQDWQDRFTIELTRHCGSHKLAINASARQRAEVFLHTSAKWRASEQAALDKSPPA